MKFTELKALTREDLIKKQRDLEFELLKARAQSARGTVAKNPHIIHTMKQTLARITFLLANQTTSTIQTPVSPASATAAKPRRGGLKRT